MAFTPVTLTGKFSDGSDPLLGTLTVTLSEVMSNSGVVVSPNSKVLTLDGSGQISQSFYANGDLDTVPYLGAWYEVTEQFSTANAQVQQRDYSIQIPAYDTPYSFSFVNGTTAGVTGPGIVNFNSTNYAAVTTVFVSITDSIGRYAATWVDGLVGGNVVIYNGSNPNNYAIFTVNSYGLTGGVIALSVTFVKSNGLFGGEVGDLVLGQPITTIDISDLMPGTPGGFNPTKHNPAGSVQWTTYLDMPEVLAWLQFTSAPTVGSNQSEMLQRLIDAACYIAQDIANRPLCPTTFYERHDGWSGEYIQLNYSPIVKLIQCQEWQSTGGMVQCAESTPENPIDGVQVDYDTGHIMRTFAGGSWPKPFFPGSRNIEVIYVAGYDPVPSNVWMATVQLVAFWWRHFYQASRTFTKDAGGPKREGGSDLWPGVPNEIAQVFESYYMHTVG